MQNYFHADTSKYRKTAAYISTAAGIILALPALLCLMSLILGYNRVYDEGFVLYRVIIVVGIAALWLIISFLAYSAARTKTERVSRLTYLEIDLHCAILSVYSGSWTVMGYRTVSRTLYVIPLENLKVDYKKGRLKLSVKQPAEKEETAAYGKAEKIVIRKYTGDSETLGYHIRAGKPEFDNWWLDRNGYEAVESIILPPVFRSPSFIARCLKIALRRSERVRSQQKKPQGMPAKKPAYRPGKRVIRYTPARSRNYEPPTFDRKW